MSRLNDALSSVEGTFKGISEPVSDRFTRSDSMIDCVSSGTEGEYAQKQNDGVYGRFSDRVQLCRCPGPNPCGLPSLLCVTRRPSEFG